jgi:anaerobic magnesium-protoporphyrin IX monomethyl ester cyclase
MGIYGSGDQAIMNILLINPSPPDIFPPPALGYLKAFIKAQVPQAAVQLADFQAALRLASSAMSYDLIGISVHSFAVRNTMALLSRLKQRFPHAHFVAGGHHASALPDQVLAWGFDQVVIGPGEEALVEIIGGNREKKLLGHPSSNLDDLPFPDYAGLGGQWSLPLYQRGKALPIISSRGCPYQCRFCASSNFWHRRWFSRSPDNVLAEISLRLQSGQMNAFMFEDDNFTLKRSRALEICHRLATEIRPRFPYLRWQAASRAESLADAELCEALAAAGCTHLWLGVESGSAAILERCAKNTTVERMLAGIETAHTYGLETVGQFIVGLIGETDLTIEESRDFIKRSKLSFVGVNKAWVLPGTYLYDYAVEKGFQAESYWDGVPFFTWEHPEAVLDQWAAVLQQAGTGFPPPPWPIWWRQKVRQGASRMKRVARRIFHKRG